jgi:hypothetical protein
MGDASGRGRAFDQDGLDDRVRQYPLAARKRIEIVSEIGKQVRQAASGQAFDHNIAMARRRSAARVREGSPGKIVKVIADLMPREALVDIDVTVTRVNDALGAYRLRQSLSVAELRRLHQENQSDD